MANLYIRYPSDPSITPTGTQDVNLIKVGGSTFTLGQQLSASSLPVVLTASQLSTLTPLSTVAATQSGTWNVGLNAGSNVIGSISNTSFAVTQATASSLNATIVGTTAAGSGASTGLVTVQGNASGTAIPVSLSANQSVNLSQVGGTSFALGQQLGASSLPVVLTAAQLTTLTPITGGSTSANQTNGTQKTQIVDGSNNVISSTSNALNVNVSSGTVTTTNSANGNTGSAVPTQATYIGGNYGGNLIGLKLDSAGELLVQQADSTATGTITSNQSVSIALNGAGTVGIQIAGTWTGSITSEGSVDGTNYSALPCAALTSGGIGSVFSINNIFQASVAGLAYMRMRGTTVATGTATISLISNHSVGAMSVLNSLPSGTNTIGSISNISGTVSLPTGAATAANQTNASQKTQIVDGSGNVIASTSNALNVSATGTVAATQSGTWTVQPGNTANTTPWLVKGNDSTNSWTIKAASTAAATTDTALVVAISPNNTVGVAAPTGRARANAPVVTTYSSTNVTSGAYVQLVASTTSATNMIEIFDSSGVALYFATGAAGSEVNQFVIYPGGNGQVNFAIAASTRLSVKAVSTSATSGTGIINLYT